MPITVRVGMALPGILSLTCSELRKYPENFGTSNKSHMRRSSKKESESHEKVKNITKKKGEEIISRADCLEPSQQ